jgi:endonuclease III
VLWENVAYLVSDEQRAKAFGELERRVGLSAREIDRAGDRDLLRVARLGGMRPPDRVKKLRRVAQIALADFPGGERELLERGEPAIRRVLKKFPGIGDPGADRILLFEGVSDGPAFDSNGLRVLARLGLIREQKDYARTYRSARAAASEAAGTSSNRARLLQDSFLLLRRLGQDLCKRSEPLCGECPLKKNCPASR